MGNHRQEHIGGQKLKALQSEQSPPSGGGAEDAGDGQGGAEDSAELEQGPGGHGHGAPTSLGAERETGKMKNDQLPDSGGQIHRMANVPDLPTEEVNPRFQSHRIPRILDFHIQNPELPGPL